MESPTTPETGEEFESIPWDSLLDEDSRRTRRRAAVAAVAVVALAISAGAARTLWARPTEPVIVESPRALSTAPSVSSATVPSLTSATSAVSSPAPLSEADLMAVDATTLEVAAAGYAAVWLNDAFTVTGASHSFVEDIRPLETRDLGDGRVAVVLAFRTLEDIGDGYERMPLRAAELVVDMTGSHPSVVDLPVPVEPPPLTLQPVDMKGEQAPRQVLDSVLGIASEWGTPDVDAVGRVGNAWRVELTVTDGAGLEWPVSVWVDQSGIPLPAGG